MSLDGKLLRRAIERLEERNRLKELEISRMREKVYSALPRVGEIDGKMAESFAAAAYAALDGGSRDPEETIRKIAIENLALQAERAELMSGAGFAPDCLDEKFFCEKCSDRGFIGSKPCVCLMELYNKEQKSELSQLLKLGEETFDSFNIEYYDSASEKGGVSPRENMDVVYEICSNYAQRFGEKEKITNLFMSGAPGLGKTFLSTCIAKVVSELGFSVVYDTAVSVFSRFEDEHFSRANVDTEELRADIARYMNCDLLILDDLGTEMTTAFTISALYDLINTRIRTNKKTIISSNLTADDVRRRYSTQIASRLDGDYTLLRFIGRDIRKIKKP